MTDVLTPEQEAALSASDLAAEREAGEVASRSVAANIVVSEDEIAIFDPEHESLVYGPANEIKFGPKGGFEPQVWIGPRVIGSEESNLVAQMMEAHPRMFEIGAEKKTYVCGDCAIQGRTPNEFKTLMAYKGHLGRVHPKVVKS